jgi:hypothetical protein
LVLNVGSESLAAQSKEQERPRDPQETCVPQFAQVRLGYRLELLPAGGFPSSFAVFPGSHSRICTEHMFLYVARSSCMPPRLASRSPGDAD